MGRKDKAISQESTEVIPIGTRLRYVRQSKKVSLTEMAAKLNYTKGYLSGVENGKMKPSESLVRNYEAALDLEPDELKELVQLLQTAGLPDKQLIWYMSHRR
ncbi:MAG TPA: helix-turn-helix transcriptional regulator, partial [Methylomirabilota bacterium]|nr:helix-turn-helix transcriptional regulator [Methylomirabilota bacterium]